MELAGECQEIEIQLQGEHTIDFIVLKETIEKGQRVEKFAVDIWREDQWKEVYQATTIGYQRSSRFRQSGYGCGFWRAAGPFISQRLAFIIQKNRSK